MATDVSIKAKESNYQEETSSDHYCSEKEPEDEGFLFKTEPNKEHSSPKEITDCLSASSREQSQIIETDPDESGISLPDDDSVLPSTCAYNIPGISSNRKESKELITEESHIITGEIIDNTFVVDEDNISNAKVDEIETDRYEPGISSSNYDSKLPLRGAYRSDEEPAEDGEVPFNTENEIDYLSPNEEYSYAQNISGTHIETTDGSPAVSNEQSQISETDTDAPLPGAYYISGIGSNQIGANEIINAVSEIVIGDAIDNAIVLSDVIISDIQVDRRDSYYISVINITVTISVILALSITLALEFKTKIIKNETVQNNQLHDYTQATIDDFKHILIQSNISSIDDMMNSSSAQSKALSWMTDENRTIFLLEDSMVESLIQRYVSVVFYYSLNGENWSNQYSFLTEGISECLWGGDIGFFPDIDGITCNINGNVSRIVVVTNNASGTIPSEVGQLNSLYRLNLIDNDISGTIPSSIGELDTLYHLNLGFNDRLTGTIPISLTNLTNLARLGLANPYLTGFEDFCPLLEVENIPLEIDCVESQLLDKEICEEYTTVNCCETIKDGKLQCCPSNPTGAKEKCYDPKLLPFP